MLLFLVVCLLTLPSSPAPVDSSSGSKRNMCCPSSGPASPSCSPLSPFPWRSPAGERRELASPELPAPPRGPSSRCWQPAGSFPPPARGLRSVGTEPRMRLAAELGGNGTGRDGTGAPRGQSEAAPAAGRAAEVASMGNTRLCGSRRERAGGGLGNEASAKLTCQSGARHLCFRFGLRRAQGSG